MPTDDARPPFTPHALLQDDPALDADIHAEKQSDDARQVETPPPCAGIAIDDEHLNETRVHCAHLALYEASQEERQHLAEVLGEYEQECHEWTRTKIERDAYREQYEASEREKATLLAERDEARDWVRRLTRANVLTCVYCGHEYPPGTPAANDDALTAHIAVCEKHPMLLERVRRGRTEAALCRFKNGECWCDDDWQETESHQNRCTEARTALAGSGVDVLSKEQRAEVEKLRQHIRSCRLYGSVADRLLTVIDDRCPRPDADRRKQ